jgi:hypothetical protein
MGRISSAIARQRLGKDILAIKKNCWRSRILYGPCRINGN